MQLADMVPFPDGMGPENNVEAPNNMIAISVFMLSIYYEIRRSETFLSSIHEDSSSDSRRRRFKGER
jgi:hypothetical protein